MMNKDDVMHILVTNDDGVYAPGIRALAEALKSIATVSVIAPTQNKSGSSNSITLDMPLRATETPMGYWQLSGTPTDCVKLAFSGFLPTMPDMVVSGINTGSNLGDDIIYSGTVGAAVEGRFFTYPSIAVSSVGRGEHHFEAAAKVTSDLVKRVIAERLDPGVILNVNVPNVPYEDIQGYQVVRQGDRHFSEPVQVHKDARDRPIYWIGKEGEIKDGGDGTDFGAIEKNYVSVTPIQIDMTDHKRLASIATWMKTTETIR